jgi:hypothetical protein
MDREEKSHDNAKHISVKAPSMEKMFAVAAGMDEFTPEERAWFDQAPERHERHQELRAAILDRKPKNEGWAQGLSERIEKPRKDEPPPRR